MNTQLSIHLGSAQDVVSETRFTERLRRELAGVPGPVSILANFVAPGHIQRQIDFLIRTPARLAMVELKTLDQSLPLLAPTNGPWGQLYPDGSVHSFGRSTFDQAREATFALSDAMADFVAQGGAAAPIPPGTKHYLSIETLVCVNPGIPVGSQLGNRTHVTVVTPEELFDRLAERGRNLPWTPTQWRDFCGFLGVVPLDDTTPDGQRRRRRLNQLNDYGRRLVATIGSQRPVDLPGTVDGAHVEELDVASILRPNRVVTIHGPSGSGKTTLARATAVEASGRGDFAMVIGAADYEGGPIDELLDRALRPNTSVPTPEILAAASAAAPGVVVILDQVDRCPDEWRAELLGQIENLRQSSGASLAVVSTERIAWPGAIEQVSVSLGLPTGFARAEILAMNGAAAGLDLGPGVSLPLHLAIAGQCAADLGPKAERLEVLGAYVRRQCGDQEVVRAGLRRLASHLAREVRASMTHADASVVLMGGRTGAPLAPSQVDQVLASPLLAVEQGRVRFVHETFESYLLAEDIILSATGGQDLAVRIARAPVAAADVIAMEPDPVRRTEALLWSGSLYLCMEAVRGEFGPEVRRAVIAQAIETVVEAAHDMGRATVRTAPGRGIFGDNSVEWDTMTLWDSSQRLSLAVVGQLFRHGEVVDEVLGLIDATDAAITRALAGFDHPGWQIASAMVGDCYAATWSRGDDRHPAAHTVLRSMAFGWIGTGPMLRSVRDDGPPPSAVGLIERLLAVDGPAWGRVSAACSLANLNPDEGSRFAPAIVRAAETAGTYYLRVDALTFAASAGRRLTPKERRELVEALEDINPRNNWAISTLVVEALAACGEIEPLNSRAEIEEQVAAALAGDPADPATHALARKIYANQLETEDVLGPYSEVLGELSRLDYVRLITLAAAAKADGWLVDTLMGELADHATELGPLGQAILERRAGRMEGTEVMRGEVAAAHLAGIRGWAKIADRLPASHHADDAQGRAWRAMDQLLFTIALGDPGASAGLVADADEAWEMLTRSYPVEGAIVLSDVRAAGQSMGLTGRGALDQLLARWPAQMAALAFAALERRSAFSARPWDSDGAALCALLLSEVIAEVSDESALNRLRELLEDPVLSELAESTIRRIERGPTR